MLTEFLLYLLRSFVILVLNKIFAEGELELNKIFVKWLSWKVSFYEKGIYQK